MTGSADRRHATRREIADLADGVLAGARRARVVAHVRGGCDMCEAALARHARVVGAIADGALPAVPARTLRRARALFAGARRRALVERVHEVVATLVLDLRPALAPALRGGPGDARRLLWTVGEVEIVVSVTVRRGRADVLGEVILPGADDVAADADRAAGTLVLSAADGGRAAVTCPLDADGAFAARGVPAGTYVLSGSAQGAAFRTPPFVIA